MPDRIQKAADQLDKTWHEMRDELDRYKWWSRLAIGAATIALVAAAFAAGAVVAVKHEGDQRERDRVTRSIVACKDRNEIRSDTKALGDAFAKVLVLATPAPGMRSPAEQARIDAFFKQANDLLRAAQPVFRDCRPDHLNEPLPPP
jgi:hypothetical protein